MNLDKNYWENRYQQQQIGWDLGTISPPIKHYADGLHNKNLQVLIPGCGNAHEAEYLIELGFTCVTVIDFAKSALANLQQVQQQAIEQGRLKLVCENFFDHKGQYDLIVEQTFFCALDPSLRNAYVNKMKGLLKPDGKLVGLLFNKQFDGGPPFGGSVAEYHTYFDALFSYVSFEPCLNSVGPRIGSEVWMEVRP
jgi:SAM-dependent methyltransferase